MCTCIYTCTCILMCMYMCNYAHVHVHNYILMYMYIHVHVHVHICAYCNYNLLSLTAANEHKTSISSSSINTISELFQARLQNIYVLECGRPDHVTYRQLLWKCMERFSVLSESRSKLFIPLFFNFLE